MKCSKRHTYLTQFYRTVVDNFLPQKRRDKEEEGWEILPTSSKAIPVSTS